MVTKFIEKPIGDGGLINAGFFVLNTGIFDFIKDDNTVWEKEPLNDLVSKNELMSYFHNGFWQPMDSLRDKIILNNYWSEGKLLEKMVNLHLIIENKLFKIIYLIIKL